VQAMVDLLAAVHNNERFADRATNICERAIFVATGNVLEFDGSTRAAGSAAQNQ